MNAPVLSRRFFLGGALALAGAALLPAAAAPVPTIFADGVRDDWAGLQALLDGRRFRADSSLIASFSEGAFNNARLLVSQALHVRRSDFTIADCQIRCMPGFKPHAPVFKLNNVRNVTLRNLHIICPRPFNELTAYAARPGPLHAITFKEQAS